MRPARRLCQLEYRPWVENGTRGEILAHRRASFTSNAGSPGSPTACWVHTCARPSAPGTWTTLPFTLTAVSGSCDSASFIVKGVGVTIDEAVVFGKFHCNGSITGIRYLEGSPGVQDSPLPSFHFFPLKKSKERLAAIPSLV